MPNPDSYQFARLVTGIKYSYSVCDAGYVIRTLNSGIKETKVKAFLDRGRLIVCFNNNKRHVLKTLVAKHFLEGYQQGWPIEPIDGDETNCAVWNLKQYSPKDFMQRYRHKMRSKPIYVNGVFYPSMTAAAKAIPIDRTALHDHLKGVKIPALEGYSVKMF